MARHGTIAERDGPINHTVTEADKERVKKLRSFVQQMEAQGAGGGSTREGLRLLRDVTLHSSCALVLQILTPARRGDDSNMAMIAAGDRSVPSKYCPRLNKPELTPDGADAETRWMYDNAAIVLLWDDHATTAESFAVGDWVLFPKVKCRPGSDSYVCEGWVRGRGGGMLAELYELNSPTPSSFLHYAADAASARAF